ncbi:MAG TPA: calcium-binding EGF-like domain-containing protein, partial [Polyangiales bacterium]
MSRLRAAWLLVVLFWTACSEVPATAPTQVMLRIHNQDSALLAQMTDLRVSLYRRDGATWPFRDSTLHSLRQLKWPVEIPILPSSVAAESKDFEVVIEALQGDQVLAETRAVSGFVPGEWRLLEVALFMCPRAPTLPACAPAGCHALECQLCTPLGECAPIERIEPTTQPAFDPNTSQVDAAVGAGSDAELPRPSADASTSADAGTPNLADAGATSDAASSARDAAPGGSVDGGADKPVDAGSPAGDAAGPADPCERAACASEATCAVVGGAARCTCKPEFAGDGGVCTALPPGVVQRGPDPTLASASMQGPYTVMSY